MNYVVRVRRENRQLRRQLACLSEMREIEAIKAQLLHASCAACDTAAAPANVCLLPQGVRLLGGKKWV